MEKRSDINEDKISSHDGGGQSDLDEPMPFDDQFQSYITKNHETNESFCKNGQNEDTKNNQNHSFSNLFNSEQPVRLIEDDDQMNYDEFLYMDSDGNFKTNFCVNYDSQMEAANKLPNDSIQFLQEDVQMESNFDWGENDNVVVSTIRSDWQEISDTRLASFNETETELFNNSKNEDSVYNWKLQKKKLDENELAEVETCASSLCDPDDIEKDVDEYIFWLDNQIDESPNDEMHHDIHSEVFYENSLDHDYGIFPNVYTDHHEEMFENRKYSNTSCVRPKIEETKEYENVQHSWDYGEYKSRYHWNKSLFEYDQDDWSMTRFWTEKSSKLNRETNKFYQILGMESGPDQNCFTEEFRISDKNLSNHKQIDKDKILSQTRSNLELSYQEEKSNLGLISDQFCYDNTNEVLNHPNIINSFEPIKIVKNGKF